MGKLEGGVVEVSNDATQGKSSWQTKELSLCGLTVLDRNLWSNFALIMHLLGLRI